MTIDLLPFCDYRRGYACAADNSVPVCYQGLDLHRFNIVILLRVVNNISSGISAAPYPRLQRAGMRHQRRPVESVPALQCYGVIPWLTNPWRAAHPDRKSGV